MNEIKWADAHAHILPSIDDGAVDEEESEAMLELLAGQNVKLICLTPHYYHYKESLDTFLARREVAFQKINLYASKLGIRLILAAEVFLTEDLLNEPDLSALCYQPSRFMLTEPPWDSSFTPRELSLMERVSSNCGVTLIVAHIERYPALMKSKRLVLKLIEAGCQTQVNLSSLANSSVFSRNKPLDLLREGLVHFIGTDCHGVKRRPPEFIKYTDILTKKLGQVFLAQLQEDMARKLVEL